MVISNSMYRFRNTIMNYLWCLFYKLRKFLFKKNVLCTSIFMNQLINKIRTRGALLHSVYILIFEFQYSLNFLVQKSCHITLLSTKIIVNLSFFCGFLCLSNINNTFIHVASIYQNQYYELNIQICEIYLD